MSRSTQFWQPTVALSAMLAAVSLVALWQAAMAKPGLDFYHYWITSQAVSQHWCPNIYSEEGRKSIYSEAANRAARARLNPYSREAAAITLTGSAYQNSVETAGSPLVYTFFNLLASGDYERDYHWFAVVNLACLVLAAILFCRLAGYSATASLILLAILCIGYEPLQSNVRVGNVNLLQLAFLAAFLFTVTRRWRFADIPGGAILALLVLFKPNLLLVAVAVLAVYLLNGRFRKAVLLLAGIALGSAIGVGISAAFFGRLACWSNWLAIVPQMLHSDHTVQQGNVGLARGILEAWGVDLSAIILAVLLAAFLVSAWLGRRRKTTSTSPDAPADAQTNLQQVFLATGLGAGMAILSARLAWLHYYLLALPLLIYAFRPSLAAKGPGEILAYRLLGLAAIFPMCNAVNLFDFAPTVSLCLLNVGALILVGLGMKDLFSAARPSLVPIDGKSCRTGSTRLE